MKKIKRNDNEKKRISGIEVEEEDELDKGLQDIVELFDAWENTKWEECSKEKRLELDALQDEELRLNSRTVKRKLVKGKRVQVKNQKNEAPSTIKLFFFLLKEVYARKNEFRHQELDLQRQEIQNFQILIAN